MEARYQTAPRPDDASDPTETGLYPGEDSWDCRILGLEDRYRQDIPPSAPTILPISKRDSGGSSAATSSQQRQRAKAKHGQLRGGRYVVEADPRRPRQR